MYNEVVKRHEIQVACKIVSETVSCGEVKGDPVYAPLWSENVTVLIIDAQLLQMQVGIFPKSWTGDCGMCSTVTIKHFIEIECIMVFAMFLSGSNFRF